MDRAWRVALMAAGGPAVDPTSVAPEELALVLRRHRLLSHAAGCPAWTDDQRRLLRPLWLAGQARSLAHARAQDLAIAALTGDGVRATALKGVAFQRATTGHATGRDHRDIDLWVSPSDFHHAVERLSREGWNAPSFGRLPNELSLSNDDGLTLDLHQHLFNRRYALAPVDVALASLLNDDGVLPIDGHAFLAVLHGAKDGWSTLRHVADVAVALHLADPHHLDDLARDTRTVHLLQVARQLADVLLHAKPVTTGHPRVRQVIEALRGPRVEAPTFERTLSFLLTREDWRDRVAIVAGIPLQSSVADAPTSTVLGHAARRTVRLLRTYGTLSDSLGGRAWQRTPFSES